MNKWVSMGMAKGSRRLAMVLLFLPFLYFTLLRLNFWNQKLSSLMRNSIVSEQKIGFSKFLLQRLVKGDAYLELIQNGVSCVSDQHSDFCVTTNAVRIVFTASGVVLHLTAGENSHSPVLSSSLIRPYPRKTDPIAMSRTSPVTLLSNHPHPPPCDAVHPSPAFIFSAGGFAGNFFHDINDVLLPLFLTASPVLPNLHLVIIDLQPYWSLKYRPFLRRLSSFAPISPTPTTTHCFPSAVLGLKYHGDLLCNETEPPGAVSTHDFRRFLHRSLPTGRPSGGPPLLVLLSRRKSRVLLNEEAAAGAARDAGFRVVVATPENTGRVEEFGAVVRGCGVLMGVHGAGLTNLVFMRPGAVVLQIVPWGLDWAAEAYYGRPARRMRLEYLDYRIAVEESTLRREYAEDDPVLADPWGVNLKGYNVSRPVYVDGQNVSLDLRRFGETLQTARRLLRGIAR